MKKGIVARYVLLCFVLVGAPACSNRKNKKPPPHAMQPKKKQPKKVKAPSKKAASEKKRHSDKTYRKQ